MVWSILESSKLRHYWFSLAVQILQNFCYDFAGINSYFRHSNKTIWHNSYLVFAMIQIHGFPKILFPLWTRPKSRGEVKLKSSDPWAPPFIDPKYLNHPDDVKILADVMMKTVQMVNSSQHLLQHGYQIPDRHIPGIRCRGWKSNIEKNFYCDFRELHL